MTSLFSLPCVWVSVWLGVAEHAAGSAHPTSLITSYQWVSTVLQTKCLFQCSATQMPFSVLNKVESINNNLWRFCANQTKNKWQDTENVEKKSLTAIILKSIFSDFEMSHRLYFRSDHLLLWINGSTNFWHFFKQQTYREQKIKSVIFCFISLFIFFTKPKSFILIFWSRYTYLFFPLQIKWMIFIFFWVIS